MKEADFLKLLDQLKYDLKVSDDRTPLMVGFEEVLNGYIERNNLGTDQHNFVTKPVISLDPKQNRDKAMAEILEKLKHWSSCYTTNMA